jgi:hypothetical protein
MRFQNILPFLAIICTVPVNAKSIISRQATALTYGPLFDNIVYATNSVTKAIKAFENKNSTAADYLIHETGFVRDLYSYIPNEVSKRGNASHIDATDVGKQLWLLKTAVDEQTKALDDRRLVLQENNWHLLIKQSLNDQYLGAMSLEIYVFPKVPKEIVSTLTELSKGVRDSMKKGLESLGQKM